MKVHQNHVVIEGVVENVDNFSAFIALKHCRFTDFDQNENDQTFAVDENEEVISVKVPSRSLKNQTAIEAIKEALFASENCNLPELPLPTVQTVDDHNISTETKMKMITNFPSSHPFDTSSRCIVLPFLPLLGLQGIISASINEDEKTIALKKGDIIRGIHIIYLFLFTNKNIMSFA